MQGFRKDQRGRNETEQLLFGSIAESSLQLFQWRQLVELEAVKAEEDPVFEIDWFPTLWRSYLVFGPSLDDPHGHGVSSPKEKSDLRKQLLMLRKKSLSMPASDDGSG